MGRPRHIVDGASNTLSSHSSLSSWVGLSTFDTARSEAWTFENIWDTNRRPGMAPFLIRAYKAAGLDDDARRILSDLETLAATEPVSAMTRFRAYLAIGDKNQALDWLETAVRTHDTYGTFVLFLQSRNEYTELLWDEPRFQAALGNLRFRH